MKKLLPTIALVVSVWLIPVRSDAALISLQTFDDPHGWYYGGGAAGIPATSFPTALGGPSGATDPFLLLTSTGLSGPQSRLTAINTTEFTGDYTAAGVTAISMDLFNFGATDLFLRLLLVDLEGGVPVNAAFTVVPVFIAGSSGWQHFVFDLTLGGLAGAGIGTVAGALADVDQLRIFHNPDPAFDPPLLPAVAASLGVDNISTGQQPAVPEPATTTLVLLGLAAMTAKRCRRAE